MIKKPVPLAAVIFTAGFLTYYFIPSDNASVPATEVEVKENDGYDGPMERGLMEMLKTKDPATDIVPIERLYTALVKTEQVKQQVRTSATDFVWEERGPIYDSVGPSGNRRGSNPQPSGTFTAGRIRALLIDASDPTGNTVWAGGISGGLWKTANFLSATPEWQIVSDFFDNMSLTSLAQDPLNNDVMYFSTGEATSNSGAVLGKGVWKSTDHGLTWALLPGTANFTRNFKILTDKVGNIYLATRSYGLQRSTNGGNTWTDISPSGISAATNESYCTDIEFAGDRLLASFGYTTSSSGGVIAVRYTDAPANVSSGLWQTPVGLPVDANRIELAARGDTAYAAPTNTSNNVVSTYKSFDGGATWTKNNVTNYTSTGIANGQGWYNLALEISPVNGLEFLVGGLDAYRSINGGLTVARTTYWVNTLPYVHADHHNYKWMLVDGQLRVIMATDGGLFYSSNNAVTFQDRNKGLAIKQFYSGAIHPTRQHYLLAGAQDNGSHQFKNPGKSYSIEVTGGDGAFVDIDQKNGNNQFTSYVYNQYRRSLNDGVSWSSFNLSSSRGYFINPYDFDDSLKIMYASFAYSAAPNKSLLRWNNPTTATNTSGSDRDTLVINELQKGTSASNVSALMTSPYTHDRIFIGGHNGSLVRIDNISTVSNANIDFKTTVLTGPSFSNGFINNIAIGKSDNELLAVFSNYGVTNLWYTNNGGTTWSAIDGNLPDMPVRWALFHPTEENKLIIATETGVWTTNMINGSSTNWMPSGNFPSVRTDMLKYRASDRLILAATYGRGLWTTNIADVLSIKDITLSGALQSDGKSLLIWKTVGETSATKFSVEFSADGASFTSVASLAGNVKSYKHLLTAPTGYYRIKGKEPNAAAVYSNTITIRNTATLNSLQVKIFPNPVSSNSNFAVTAQKAGNFTWMIIDAQGKVLQTGKGNANAGVTTNVPINASALPGGVYRLRIMQDKESVIQSFIKQ